ncbi:MAG: zinc-dependent alcohol dehydrogenase family protein [Bacteroidota bacterium]
MRAAVFEEPKRIAVRNTGELKPGKEQVLIQVEACGVCGTDFHIFSGEAPASMPVITGHEYAGIIVEAGSAVPELKPGDRIAVDPNIACGYCRYCREGRINLCANLQALGVTLNGGFAQYSLVPFRQAYRIASDVDPHRAAFAEPLSCCLHGIRNSGLRPGDSVVIAGAGTIGLLMLQLARINGAQTVVVLEPSSYKRDMALQLGADFALNPSDDDYTAVIADVTGGGANVAIECAGNEPAALSTFRVVRKGGTILLFGLSAKGDKISFNQQSFFHNELTIKSSLLNPFTFQRAVDLINSGNIRTDLFNISNVALSQDSFDLLFTGTKNETVIKYMVTPNSQG